MIGLIFDVLDWGSAIRPVPCRYTADMFLPSRRVDKTRIYTRPIYSFIRDELYRGNEKRGDRGSDGRFRNVSPIGASSKSAPVSRHSQISSSTTMARFNSANLHELRRIIGSRVGVPEFCFNGTSNKDTGASVDARIVDLTIVTSKRCCERAYALISVRCVDDGRVYQLPAWTLFVIPSNAAALFVPEICLRDERLYQPGYARNVIFSELCNSFGVKSALVLDGPSGNTARMLRSHVPTVYQATNDATALLALAAQGDVPLHVPMCGRVGPSGARPRVSGVYQMLHRAYTKPGSLTIEARRAATEAEAMALDIFGAWNAPMYDDVLSAMATRKPRSVEVVLITNYAMDDSHATVQPARARRRYHDGHRVRGLSRDVVGARQRDAALRRMRRRVPPFLFDADIECRTARRVALSELPRSKAPRAANEANSSPPSRRPDQKTATAASILP
eukprot:gene2783-3572_t